MADHHPEDVQMDLSTKSGKKKYRKVSKHYKKDFFKKLSIAGNQGKTQNIENSCNEDQKSGIANQSHEEELNSSLGDSSFLKMLDSAADNSNISISEDPNFSPDKREWTNSQENYLFSPKSKFYYCRFVLCIALCNMQGPQVGYLLCSFTSCYTKRFSYLLTAHTKHLQT